jgi:hypothetical protein
MMKEKKKSFCRWVSMGANGVMEYVVFVPVLVSTLES